MRINRFLELAGRGCRLLFTGQFGTLRAILRHGFRHRFAVLAPIEYVSPSPREMPAAMFADAVNHVDGVDMLAAYPPLVSVIIPCFNYGAFLERAVDSVLAQTLTRVEIIVVEGGSTDGATRELARRLERPRTRVILQDKATLVGENRNRGIAEARGRYVCCLDADDTIDPTYLEKAVYLLETHRYDLVSTGIRLLGARAGTIDLLETPTLRDMTEGNHVTTCAVFRRDLWERTGGFFDTGKGVDHVAEDWDLWLRFAATGARFRNITGEHLFNYTVHSGGSLSSSPDVRARAEQRTAILARNGHLLGSKSYAESWRQSRRRIALSDPGGSLIGMFPHSGSDRRSVLIALPFLIVGGAERLLSSIVRHLSAAGWKVTVISTLPQEGHDDSSAWFTGSIAEVYMLPRFLKTWEHEGFVRYLLASRGYDVLLLAGSRLIYDLLPGIYRDYPDLAVVDLLFNTVGHTASHALHRGEITFAIGENPQVMKWFIANGWTEGHTRLIESGVDVSRFSQSRPLDLAERLGIRDDDVVVGFSGRLSEEKAPEAFLEIAAALRDVPRARFVMTGGGPLRATIEAKVRKLPPGVRFDFLGMVDSTVDYFALYDLFVLPSRLDGRPVALLEALASGCAVVASRVGGIPAVLEGTEAGVLCPPADVTSFANEIRALVAAPEKLRAMKRAARETANRMLSEAQMGAAYEDALNAAIDLKRRGALHPPALQPDPAAAHI